MRTRSTLALAVAVLLIPTTAMGQDTATSPEPSGLTVAASSDVAYSCISYDSTVSQDVSLAISQDDYEVVPTSYCGLADVPNNFDRVAVSGKGTQRSKPFFLPAGDFKVDIVWGKGCLFSKDLPDPGSMYLNDIDAPDDAEGLDFVQSSYAYGVEEGRYYMKVNTTTETKCKWAFRISPYEE